MDQLRRIVDSVLAWLLIVLMFVAVVNVLWQVFTRWVLNDPSSYTEELARYLLIWIGLLGAGYAAGKKMHLAIDLLPNKLVGARSYALEILIDGLILAFAVLVMVVGGYRLMSLTLLMGQQSAALGIQLGWVYSVIPLSGAVIAFYAGIAIVDRIQVLRGKREDKGERFQQKQID